MALKKFCDYCKTEIKSVGDGMGFSEWVLFHYKKRRDFDSLECLLKFVNDYVCTKLNSHNTGDTR